MDIETVRRQYEEQFLDTRSIAALHNVSQFTIIDRMKKAGINLRSPGHIKVLDVLSSEQLEIVSGELLGDGCLHVGRHYKNARFQWGGRFYGHGYIINSCLGNLASFFAKSNGYWKLCSKAAVTFTEVYNKWYPNGKKMVPKDIALTPKVVLHWYMGDGYLKIRNGRLPNISLSTQCFGTACLKLLQSKLLEIGLVNTLNQNNNGQIIRISSYYTNKFLEFIGPCPTIEYAYKWL
jgi:hypothetical protein